jgi:hypothetical protein
VTSLPARVLAACLFAAPLQVAALPTDLATQVNAGQALYNDKCSS